MVCYRRSDWYSLLSRHNPDTFSQASQEPRYDRREMCKDLIGEWKWEVCLPLGNQVQKQPNDMNTYAL